MEEFESYHPSCENVDSKAEHSIRAELREQFLFLISNLTGGRECAVDMYENTKVTCNVRAFDSSFQSIIVENLITPLPVPIKKAILRTNDIIALHFNDVSDLKLVK